MPMTPEQVEIYSKMDPVRKLEIAAEFNHSARRFKAAALRMQHPDWSATQIEARVREIFLLATD